MTQIILFLLTFLLHASALCIAVGCHSLPVAWNMDTPKEQSTLSIWEGVMTLQDIGTLTLVVLWTILLIYPLYALKVANNYSWLPYESWMRNKIEITLHTGIVLKAQTTPLMRIPLRRSTCHALYLVNRTDSTIWLKGGVLKHVS